MTNHHDQNDQNDRSPAPGGAVRGGGWRRYWRVRARRVTVRGGTDRCWYVLAGHAHGSMTPAQAAALLACLSAALEATAEPVTRPDAVEVSDR